MLSGWIFFTRKIPVSFLYSKKTKRRTFICTDYFPLIWIFQPCYTIFRFFCVKWMSWNKTSVSTDFCQTTAHPQCGWKNETSASFALTAQRHRAFCGFCQHAHNDSSCQPRSTGWQQILFYWGRAELHQLWSQEPTELLWTELQLRAVLKILI